jgi:heme exporter protein A
MSRAVPAQRPQVPLIPPVSSPVPRADTEQGAPLAVNLDDVSYRFGRDWALAHVSLELRAADSLLVIGPNGAGKTTLLRLLASAISPSLGTVRVLGLDPRRQRDEWRRRVGLLSHANYLYEDLSAEENLMLVARVLCVERPAATVSSCLEKVGLAQRAAGPIRTFSAGMRKRVAMARMLIKDPDVVLLDEPFGELDPAGISAMEDFVRDFQKRGRTVALVTHHVEHGRSICNRVLAMRSGQVERFE